MRVRISDIGPRGLEVKGSLPRERMNERVQVGDSSEIEFLADLEVSAHLEARPGGAELTGTARSSYRQPCARCADEVSREIEVPLHFMIRDSAGVRPSEGEEHDDLGVLYTDKDSVELEAPIQEEFIVALSPFWSPPRDEEGKCGRCGRDCGRTVAVYDDGKSSLGALLEQAASKRRN